MTEKCHLRAEQINLYNIVMLSQCYIDCPELMCIPTVLLPTDRLVTKAQSLSLLDMGYPPVSLCSLESKHTHSCRSAVTRLKSLLCQNWHLDALFSYCSVSVS